MLRITPATIFALVQSPILANSLELTSRRYPQTFSGRQGCAELANKGTHFTIDVDVGTPGQRFAVVADTGSNTLIVPSCLCQQKGRCPKDDRCFTGTNKSSTFKLEQTEQGPESMVLSFGSGQIQGVVAKDNVRVGQVEYFLEDGLLLMTDRALNIAGPFEGILGLGVPLLEEALNATATDEAEAAAAGSAGVPPELQDIINQIMGGGGMPSETDGSEEGMNPMEEALRKIVVGVGGAGAVASSGQNIIDILRQAKGSANPMEEIMRKIAGGQVHKPHRQSPKGFLEQAKIDRFSVCFNDGASGVLRLGDDPPSTVHSGVGKQHWGVDFRGISVGEGNTEPADALFCKPGNMSEGQQTPCGAIPDSGTTVLMGPPAHVSALLEGICDSWERCRANFTKLEEGIAAASETMTSMYGFNPFNMNRSITKADVMQLLLMDCETWMEGPDGLAELPPLHFHVEGSNGTKQTLKIPGHLYVMEAPREMMSSIQLLSDTDTDRENIPVATNGTGNTSGKVCSPAFNTMDYNTKLNGPVWILGTPLFYEFVVGYDVSTDPPSISFSPQTETPCGTCDSKVNLAAVRGRPRARKPMRINGPPRVPHLDTTKPL